MRGESGRRRVWVLYHLMHERFFGKSIWSTMGAYF